MREYEFTLKFRLPDASADPEQFIDALAEAGCDDATVGIGRPGRIVLDFTREAENALHAIASAVQAVKDAIPGAELVEASPDFVGLTDVADIAGFSRQNMRKLMVNYPTSFPPPVHEGSTAVWHLADLLAWLQAKGGYDVDRSTADVAAAAMQINLAKAANQITRRVQREVRELVI